MRQAQDAVSQIIHTLSGPWSASSVAGMLTTESIQTFTASRQLWDAMDPLVKARLLISPLFMRLSDLEAIREGLEKIRSMAKGDSNEWVSMLAIAVDGYDGRIHTDAVLQQVAMVKETMDEVIGLAGSIDPKVYRPLEEAYVVVGSDDGAHTHFRVREPKKVANDVDRKRERVPGPAATDSKKIKSMFISAKPRPGMGRAMPPRPQEKKKKAAVLDIAAIQQARAVNEKRQKDLAVEKEKEKERQAKERAENALAEKQAKEERKRMMKEAEKKKKEMQRQQAKEEKAKALEEAKAAKKKEALEKRKNKKTMVEPVDPKDVTAALERAGIRADIRSVDDIQNPNLRSPDMNE